MRSCEIGYDQNVRPKLTKNQRKPAILGCPSWLWAIRKLNPSEISIHRIDSSVLPRLRPSASLMMLYLQLAAAPRPSLQGRWDVPAAG